MKKLLFIMMIFVSILFCACGKDKNTENFNNENKQSYNENAQNGDEYMYQ